MFIWQHLNDAHCRIQIHVLSRRVSLLPEDEKHHFPAPCESVASAVHYEQLWEEVCPLITGWRQLLGTPQP